MKTHSQSHPFCPSSIKLQLILACVDLCSGPTVFEKAAVHTLSNCYFIVCLFPVFSSLFWSIWTRASGGCQKERPPRRLQAECDCLFSQTLRQSHLLFCSSCFVWKNGKEKRKNKGKSFLSLVLFRIKLLIHRHFTPNLLY